MTRIDQPLTREVVWVLSRVRLSLPHARRIFERQGEHCAACEERLTEFQIDHILPLELGGSNDDTNLQAICTPCHKAKTRDDIKRIRKAQRLQRDASPETRRRTKNPLRSRGFQRADPLKG